MEVFNSDNFLLSFLIKTALVTFVNFKEKILDILCILDQNKLLMVHVLKSDMLLYTWRFTEQITSSLYCIFQGFSYLGESSIISPEAGAFDIISPFLSTKSILSPLKIGNLQRFMLKTFKKFLF